MQAECNKGVTITMQFSLTNMSTWARSLAPLTIAIVVSGCGPMWYGAPPPTYPPGQGLPPSQFQQPTMVPANPAPLQVPAGQVPGGLPPSTFQGGSAAGSLNEVPDASVGQVLTVPTPRSTSTYHDVQQGETLTSIARQYGVTLDAIKTANVFDSDPVLKPGDLILIP
jgi:LysM repeat protein